MARIYWLLWLAGLIVVGAFYLTGNLTYFSAVIFGFISFGLVFMGMMFVLPFSVTHPEPINKKGMTEPLYAGYFTRFGEWFHGTRAGWMSSSSVEVRRPRYR